MNRNKQKINEKQIKINKEINKDRQRISKKINI